MNTLLDINLNKKLNKKNKLWSWKMKNDGTAWPPHIWIYHMYLLEGPETEALKPNLI